MTNVSEIKSIREISEIELAEIIDKIRDKTEIELNNQLNKNILKKEKGMMEFFLLAHLVASILKKLCLKKDKVSRELFIDKFMQLVYKLSILVY